MAPIVTWLRQTYLWLCERLYHELAPGYDLVAWLVSAGAWGAWRRVAWPELEGRRVLELGFGTGALLAELAVTGTPVVGLEPSPAMQAVAGHRLATYGAAPPIVQADAQAVPLASGIFDVVVATFPAPYILAPATLHEAARLLRPQGQLVIVGLWVTLQPRWLRWLPLFYGGPPPALLTHLDGALRAAGLTPHVESHVCGWATVGVVLATKEARP